MMYAVYYRENYGPKWRLARQFETGEAADRLVAKMTEDAQRRGLDLDMLAIMTLEFRVLPPFYVEAPDEICEPTEDEREYQEHLAREGRHE